MHCPHVTKSKNPERGYATIRLGRFGAATDAASSHPGWKEVALENKQVMLATHNRVRPAATRARGIATWLLANAELVPDDVLVGIQKDLDSIVRSRIATVTGEGIIKLKSGSFFNSNGVEVDHGNNINNTWARGRSREIKERKKKAKSGDTPSLEVVLPRISITRAEERKKKKKKGVATKPMSDTRGHGKHNRKGVTSLLWQGVTKMDLQDYQNAVRGQSNM